MTENEAREIVCEYGKRLARSGLVVGTWGNLSVRADTDLMVITPSGADYERLTPSDMVAVDLRTGEAPAPDSAEGNPAGRGSVRRKPSSEKGLHEAIYLRRPDAGAVIHTHSPNASVLAAARRELPPILDDLAQIAGAGIRVAEYALPGTRKIIRETVKALGGRNAVLLANHGAVCVGRNMAEAFLCCEVLEKGCWAFIAAEFLGGAEAINRFEAALMHKVYLDKYSRLKDARPEDPRE